MKIHGYNTISLHLESSLSWTSSYTWWIIAMIAENGKRIVLYIVSRMILGLLWKDILKWSLPDPFDFAFPIINLRNIVN